MDLRQPSVDPAAVERALAYLRVNGARYTRESLEASLREQGYADEDIAAAFERLAAKGPRDLRGRAATFLLAGFGGVWLALTLAMTQGAWAAGGAWAIGSAILGTILVVLLLGSLLGVAASDRLRRGVEGALVTVLTIPFVLLFVVAGLCVVSLRG